MRSHSERDIHVFPQRDDLGSDLDVDLSKRRRVMKRRLENNTGLKHVLQLREKSRNFRRGSAYGRIEALVSENHGTSHARGGHRVSHELLRLVERAYRAEVLEFVERDYLKLICHL
jgi:hypothetical protein